MYLPLLLGFKFPTKGKYKGPAMQKLFWGTLSSEEVAGTIWSTSEVAEDAPYLRDLFPDLNDFFAKQEKKKKKKGKGKGKDGKAKKPKKPKVETISFISGEAAQNIHISISRFNKIGYEGVVRALNGMDVSDCCCYIHCTPLIQRYALSSPLLSSPLLSSPSFFPFCYAVLWFCSPLPPLFSPPRLCVVADPAVVATAGIRVGGT